MVNLRSGLDLTFGALADPSRRVILASLADDAQTVGALAEPLPMSLVAVSKHITVLERAGLVSRVKTGRAHLCTLRPAPLAGAADWLSTYRRFWTGRIDALEQYLTVEDR